MTPEEKREIENYNKRRDEILRALDVDAAVAFAKEFDPAEGLEGVKRENVLAGLHKARLHINSFTAEEKFVSRLWLKSHGFDCEL